MQLAASFLTEVERVKYSLTTLPFCWLLDLHLLAVGRLPLGEHTPLTWRTSASSLPCGQGGKDVLLGITVFAQTLQKYICVCIYTYNY